MQDLIVHLVSLLGMFAAALVSPPTSHEAPHEMLAATATVMQVIDGDTIDVRIGGGRERVRYIGIDAPETTHDGRAAECYAREATAANAALVANAVVTLVAGQEDRDDYNRLLRYVYVDDTFVNEALIAAGAAAPLPIEPNTRYARRFYELSETARAEGRGRWGACDV